MLSRKDFNYLHIAFYCGLLPLVGGVGTYVLWRLTAWVFLPYVGIGVISFGLFFVLIGFGCLANYLLNLGHTRGSGIGQRLVRAFGVTVLLLLNLPSAYLCVTSAFEVMTRYTLRISNESGQAIDNLVVSGPGLIQQLGPMTKDQHIKQYFHFHGDGSVRLKITTSTVESTTEIESYTTSASGGDKSIRINSDMNTVVSDTYPKK